MNESWPHFTAAALGVVAGFVASIPGGPVNATIVGEAARKGMRWSLFVAFGAVLMESVYCAAAFAGFSPDALGERPIATGAHCFGCTAGSGSSCGGALAG